MRPRLMKSLAVAFLSIGLVGACSDDKAAEPGPTSQSTPPVTDPAEPGSTTTGDSNTSTSQPDGSTSDDVVTIRRGDKHRVTQTSATIHCDGGGDIYVMENGATVTITGRCHDIDVPASETQVAAEAADDIDIDGSRNTVRATDVDELEIDGDANTVAVTTVREIEIDGNDNTVTFGSSEPRIDDDGSGNSVSAS